MRFFTSFDRINIPLKYIVVNPTTFQRFNTWYREYGYNLKEILLDTGVDTLFKQLNLKDYPQWWINNYINIIGSLNSFAKRHGVKVYAVIPDVPVDYKGREHLYPWNVSRTIQYIQYFMNKVIPRYKNIVFVPVVQGAKDSVLSIITTYKKYYDIYKKFEIVALGPTCSTRKYKKLANMILKFDQIAQHEYHAFGPSLKTIKLVHGKARNMHSFDSTGYFWNGNKRVHGGEERTRSLLEYCKKLKTMGIDTPVEVLGIPFYLKST